MNKGAPLREAVLHPRPDGAERSRPNVEHSVILLDFLGSEIFVDRQAVTTAAERRMDSCPAAGFSLRSTHAVAGV